MSYSSEQIFGIYFKPMFCKCGTLIQPHIPKCRRCNLKTNYQIESKVTEKHFVRSTFNAVNDRGAKIKNKCEKCGKDEMYYKTVQLRSADEGQTVFYECDCGHRMRVNS